MGHGALEHSTMGHGALEWCTIVYFFLAWSICIWCDGEWCSGVWGLSYRKKAYLYLGNNTSMFVCILSQLYFVHLLFTCLHNTPWHVPQSIPYIMAWDFSFWVVAIPRYYRDNMQQLCRYHDCIALLIPLWSALTQSLLLTFVVFQEQALTSINTVSKKLRRMSKEGKKEVATRESN